MPERSGGSTGATAADATERPPVAPHVRAVDRPAESPGATPLFVDLDGTLIATDLLWESLLSLLRSEPASLWRLPAWLLAGRARLKREIASRVRLDPAALPYRTAVLEWLRERRAAGSRLVLATAADASLAGPVAEHLGLFDDVIASDGAANRKGAGKLAAIREWMRERTRARTEEPTGEPKPDGAFDYLGDSLADVPIWREARTGFLVAGRPGVEEAARRVTDVEVVDTARIPIGPIVRAMRPRQWIKNALVFAPLVLAHRIGEPLLLFKVTLAFLCFGMVASAGYILNDLMDVEADRLHRTKRTRPFASGEVSIPIGIAAFGALLGLGFVASLVLVGVTFTALLAVYLGLTLSYSFFFKKQLLVDVLLLAGLYAHRVISGGVAADVEVSQWLLAFSGFFFLSLAFAKRYCELRDAPEAALSRRNYRREDLGLILAVGPAAGYLSILVMALYVTSVDVARLYTTPSMLWAVCVVLLYWQTRIWFLAARGELPEDPVLFAARDRNSYACALAIALVVMVAA